MAVTDSAVAIGAVCGAITALLAVLVVGWRFQRWLADLETVRAALTPDSGTSVRDMVHESRDGITRLEEALAEHRRQANARMAEMAEHIGATNSRLDRALEIIAGAPARAGDHPPRVERTRTGCGA